MKEDRIRSAWAELLLRAALEETCGISRTEQRILRRKDGKPYVSGKSAAYGNTGDLAVPENSGAAEKDSEKPGSAREPGLLLIPVIRPAGYRRPSVRCCSA